jgi:hypothetical protein
LRLPPLGAARAPRRRPRRRMRPRPAATAPDPGARGDRSTRAARCAGRARTLHGRELRLGVSAKSQRYSNDLAVKADRSVEIAHEQNRVAKTGRHGGMFAPAAASRRPRGRDVAAPGHGPTNQKLVALPFGTTRQSRPTLATLVLPQRDAEELADIDFGAVPDRRRSRDHRSGRSRTSIAKQPSSPGSRSSLDVRTDERDSSRTTAQHRGTAARRAAATTL